MYSLFYVRTLLLSTKRLYIEGWVSNEHSHNSLFDFSSGYFRSSYKYLSLQRKITNHSGDLKSGCVWISRRWFAKGPNFEWNLKSGSLTIWNPEKWQPFCQKPFEIHTKMSDFLMVPFSKGWDHSFRYSHPLKT